MIDAALKDLIKEAVREALAEQQGPLMPIAEVAKMLGCRDVRTARQALAARGVPVEQIGRGWFVNRANLEVIGQMRKAGRMAS
jgi:DNA-binding GntR family transcriptional regulator